MMVLSQVEIERALWVGSAAPSGQKREAFIEAIDAAVKRREAQRERSVWRRLLRRIRCAS